MSPIDEAINSSKMNCSSTKTAGKAFGPTSLSPPSDALLLPALELGVHKNLLPVTLSTPRCVSKNVQKRVYDEYAYEDLDQGDLPRFSVST
jgi:hypothetical protein